MRYRPTPPLRLLRRFLRSVERNGVRGAISHSYLRLFRSLKNHGFSGTFERAFLKAPKAPLVRVPPSTHPFDLRHGTDTGGFVTTDDFSATSLSSCYTTAYLGTPPSTIRPALAALPVKHQDFSFVDIGCGKGRVLFVAAEFPFRRLLGVEIVPELCDIARANAALKPEWKERIAILNQDATAFQYPEGPLVLYMFYPFSSKILRRVLANLERQLRRSPRPAYILFSDLKPPDDAPKLPDDVPTLRDHVTHQEMMHSFPMIEEISDTVYPLSAEDAAAEPSSCKAYRFLLYSADVTR